MTVHSCMLTSMPVHIHACHHSCWLAASSFMHAFYAYAALGKSKTEALPYWACKCLPA